MLYFKTATISKNIIEFIRVYMLETVILNSYDLNLAETGELI